MICKKNQQPEDLWGMMSVSGVLFNRDMTEVIRGSTDIRTIVFPNSVWYIRMGAFYHLLSLRGAVINEGLTHLTWKKAYVSRQQNEMKGIFQLSGLRYVFLPDGLKTAEEI